VNTRDLDAAVARARDVTAFAGGANKNGRSGVYILTPLGPCDGMEWRCLPRVGVDA
jgi:hypothetical protein